MRKKLPGIYHDKSTVKKSNNRNVFYSSREEGNFNNFVSNFNNDKHLTDKEHDYNHVINVLNSLFTSSHHVFMIPVLITTTDKVYDTKIIYRDNFKISTFDGDTIFIKDIVDIKIKKSL